MCCKDLEIDLAFQLCEIPEYHIILLHLGPRSSGDLLGTSSVCTFDFVQAFRSLAMQPSTASPLEVAGRAHWRARGGPSWTMT